MSKCRHFWSLAAILLVSGSLQAADSNTNRFGFTGPEIFPIDNQISCLRAADIDGDGLLDLVVVNNARSKINILYNQTGKTNPALPKQSRKKELNELPPDARFRIDSIASEKRISSLVVADLNGDKRPDIAYYGEPKELVILYNQGTNGWSAPKRFPIDDGELTVDSLAVGDLNGDGLADLVLLGENTLYYFQQSTNHTFDEPEKIAFSGQVKAVQILDINGDGRDDLLLVNWNSADPFRFRLQNANGQLEPEIHFAMPAIRSYWADDLDGDHKAEIITIAQNSGRAQVSNFVQEPAELLAGAFKQGQFQVFPLNKTAKAHRGVLWADVNGDGLPDLLVAEPDSGQLTLRLQKADGTLADPKTFPTLTGVSELAVGDWAGDGVPQIFLLSADEHQVGMTHLDKSGRIGFPTIFPMEGKPLTMALGPLKPGAKPTLAVISDQDGKRFLLTMREGEKMHSQKLSAEFLSTPSSMILHDADQDGLVDLIISIPYEKIKILLQTTNSPDFNEQDILPPGGSAEQPWLSVADVDGDGKPELLLPQKNFLRAVVLKSLSDNGTNGKPAWTFVVKEQINGASSASRITAAAPLRNGTNAIDSLFLLDAERKAVTLCERDAAGVWKALRSVTLPVTDFSKMQAVALGAGRPQSLALIGENAVASLALDGVTWQLKELDSYETPIRDGRLTDVVSGDLNNDGRKDLVFLETARNYLDIVTYEAPHNLVPANRWPVFEERTFRSRRNEGMEPREALIVDATGDGKNDLLVLVHDRILLYPQE